MERSTLPSDLGDNPGVGLGSRACHQNRSRQLDSKEDKGDKQEALNPFRALVTSLQATGVEVQPLQRVLFPGTKTVVIPPQSTY